MEEQRWMIGKGGMDLPRSLKLQKIIRRSNKVITNGWIRKKDQGSGIRAGIGNEDFQCTKEGLHPCSYLPLRWFSLIKRGTK